MMKNQWVEQAKKREMDEKYDLLTKEMFFVQYHLGINWSAWIDVPEHDRKRLLCQILRERGDIDA